VLQASQLLLLLLLLLLCALLHIIIVWHCHELPLLLLSDHLPG
jgi:hypothetical protein